MCSGKIYYDLLERFEESEQNKKRTSNIAVIRIEQLHPFPQEALHLLLKRYGNNVKVVWLQEEPRNMGAWPFISMHYQGDIVEAIARPASGTTAAGSQVIYARKHEVIMDDVMKYARK